VGQMVRGRTGNQHVEGRASLANRALLLSKMVLDPEQGFFQPVEIEVVAGEGEIDQP